MTASPQVARVPHLRTAPHPAARCRQSLVVHAECSASHARAVQEKPGMVAARLQVSKVEFMMFILEHLELVDRAELDRILAMFNAADLIGDGVLTTADVQAHCARLACNARPTHTPVARASLDATSSAAGQPHYSEHSAAATLSKLRQSDSECAAAVDAELAHGVRSGLQDLEAGQTEPLLARSQVWESASSVWESGSRGRSPEKRLGHGEE